MDISNSTNAPSNTRASTETAPEEEVLPTGFKVSATSHAHTGRTGYGIEDAIRLMQSLPIENSEVVVTVVTRTLESTNISVDDIVQDALAKEDRIREEHRQLEEEIRCFQEEIAQRTELISELLQDLKQTVEVRERLQMAADPKQQTGQPAGADTAEAASEGEEGFDPGAESRGSASDESRSNSTTGKDPASLRIAAPKMKPDYRQV
ncbi:hypothetical protein ACXYTJ_05160 [Gilvimarinus sp. F26214L]|uniref:hypothetical protein n=1 Tax=Gilvimarinus sp. DZF01 TaxID=3461371 RepID=UPI0040467648